MVTAVVESPLRQRQRQRLRSPLAGWSTGGGGEDDVEVLLRRPAKRASGSGGGMRGRRWTPPEIVIPDANAAAGGGTGRGYTSLRDIMSSPKAAISPNEPPGGAGGAVVAGDVHMIRHPLVKHAAYAYLQLTPSARDAEARRRRQGGPLCRLFLGCLGFLGALFGR